MMLKAIELPGIDKHGQALTQAIFPTRGRGGLVKSAGALHPQVAEYIRSVKPNPRFLWVLSNALGAGEYWGSNVNGDYFGEQALLHKGNQYGHETFYNAGIYQHHKNKNIDHSLGVVALVVYNEIMHRVELILKLDREKAAQEGASDLILQLDSGKNPPTSMGCFPPGTPITLANGDVKPIEEVGVGDLVLTHTGSVRKVTELHPRMYEGDLVDLSIMGGFDLSLTPEHPAWSIKRSDAMKDGRRWVESPSPGWIHASCLDEGDYITSPVMQEVLTPDYADRALARLLGYYTAEGHVLRNKKGEYAGVEFTVHEDDLILDEIDDLAKGFGARNAPVVRNRTNSEHARRVDIFDPHLAELCYDHCGSYGRGKCLSEDLMQWHPDLQKEFLGAYLNGDGCRQSDRWQPGAVTFSTASDHLAQQVPQMLARVGIPSTVNCIRHEKGDGFNNSVTFENQIYVGKQHANLLADVSKVEPVEVKKSGGGKRLFGGHLYLKIKSVTRRFYQGMVYNFEVEEDNSYVAAGYSVHNCRVPFDVCSWCHNHAKTRAEYCLHALQYMNHVASESLIQQLGLSVPVGTKMYVDNTMPKFFDESFVLVGADQTSFAIMKVASGASVPSAFLAEQYGLPEKFAALSKGGAHGKLADMLKRVPAMSLRTMSALNSAEPRIEPDLLDAMGQDRIQRPLSTCTGMGMVLTPGEFQRMLLGRLGYAGLADQLDNEHAVFRHVPGIDRSLGYDIHDFSPILRDHLMPYFGARSVFEPIIKRRVTIVIRGKVPGRPPRQEVDHPVLDKVSAAYNGYLESLPENIHTMAPVAWLDPVVGQEIRSVLSPNALEKVGGAGTALALGAFPLMYLYSRSLDRRKQKGEEIGAFKEFVRNHPIIAASALVGTLHMAKKRLRDL